MAGVWGLSIDFLLNMKTNRTNHSPSHLNSNFFAEASSLRTTEGANLFTVYNSSLLKLHYFMLDIYCASYNVYIFYMLTIKRYVRKMGTCVLWSSVSRLQSLFILDYMRVDVSYVTVM